MNRVWLCVCCGTIHGVDHDPFARCATCGEACYSLVTIEEARRRRDEIEQRRKGDRRTS